MFYVETREQAEKVVATQNYELEWIESEDGSYDCRVISKGLPAVRLGSNGRKVFFNSVYAAFHAWDKRNVKGCCVSFSDGSLIPGEFINELEVFMNTNSCIYNWQEG